MEKERISKGRKGNKQGRKGEGIVRGGDENERERKKMRRKGERIVGVGNEMTG